MRTNILYSFVVPRRRDTIRFDYSTLVSTVLYYKLICELHSILTKIDRQTDMKRRQTGWQTDRRKVQWWASPPPARRRTVAENENRLNVFKHVTLCPLWFDPVPSGVLFRPVRQQLYHLVLYFDRVVSSFWPDTSRFWPWAILDPEFQWKFSRSFQKRQGSLLPVALFRMSGACRVLRISGTRFWDQYSSS